MQIKRGRGVVDARRQGALRDLDDAPDRELQILIRGAFLTDDERAAQPVGDIVGNAVGRMRGKDGITLRYKAARPLTLRPGAACLLFG